MITKHKQRGATAITGIIGACIAGFFIYLVIILIPIYMTNSTVKDTLKELQSRPTIISAMATGTGEATIRAFLQKNFSVNNIKNITQDNVDIKSAAGGLLVTIAYDVRTPVVGNIDMVVHFNNSAKVIGG